MLVFTRKVGQSVVLGESIRVMVSRINGDKVKLAIDAPAGIRVDREEIHLARMRERSNHEPPPA